MFQHIERKCEVNRDQGTTTEWSRNYEKTQSEEQTKQFKCYLENDIPELR